MCMQKDCDFEYVDVDLIEIEVDTVRQITKLRYTII